MKNWEKKELVRSLRSKGLSYREIICAAPFSICKSTISEWCKDIQLSVAQMERLDKLFHDGSYRGRLLGSKTTQLRRQQEVREIRGKAKLEYGVLSQSEFKVAGLMLYWAEGAKSRYVDITNSDPLLIKFMVNWLRLVCEVPEDKFRASLHLHSGQNEKKIKEYWSKLIGVPQKQFCKSYIKKEGSGYRKNLLYKGTIKIRVCDSNLLYKILGWIEGVTNNLGPLAQLAEQLPLKEKVGGSTPPWPNKLKSSAVVHQMRCFSH